MTARLLGLRTSAIYHTDFPQYARFLSDDDPLVEGIAWNYMQWFYSQVDRVYVNSKSYADRWVERGMAQEKIAILPRGLDTEAFHLRHHQSDFWSCRGAVGKVVLYVGRISKEKELEFLARVAQAVPAETRVTFAFVGEGPYLAELKKRLKGAVFTGVLHGNELSQAYASADLFVFPSTTDTYGNVVVEALASGLPVIVSDQGGPGELIRDAGDGRVLKAGDLSAWVSTILDQLKSDETMESRSERRKRNIRGREWSDAFCHFWDKGLV
jgi:glycosyltransferase involved in cell wall biosynthesis